MARGGSSIFGLSVRKTAARGLRICIINSISRPAYKRTRVHSQMHFVLAQRAQCARFFLFFCFFFFFSLSLLLHLSSHSPRSLFSLFQQQRASSQQFAVIIIFIFLIHLSLGVRSLPPQSSLCSFFTLDPLSLGLSIFLYLSSRIYRYTYIRHNKSPKEFAFPQTDLPVLLSL